MDFMLSDILDRMLESECGQFNSVDEYQYVRIYVIWAWDWDWEF